jgi:DNA polymerase III subunit epsilon
VTPDPPPAVDPPPEESSPGRVVSAPSALPRQSAQARRRPVPPSRIYRRRGWREAPFVSLDFETTGLDLRRDAIVSFGAVPVRGGQLILADAVYGEVAPAAPLSAESIRVHHLRPADLRDAPEPRSARSTLAVALDRRYLLAWVAEIEIGFLGRMFHMPRFRLRQRTVDVARLLIAFDRAQGRTPSRRVSLVAACERFGVPLESAHEALDDAVMTAELFLVLATKLSTLGYPRLAMMLRESRRNPFDV